MLSYVRTYAILTLASLASLSLLNVVVDPFGAYRLIDTPLRPYVASRTAKAEMLRHLGCQDVLVGTSRVEVGIDPRSSRFGSRVVCNAGLSKTNMIEVAHVMRYAAEQPRTERILFFLDFLLFSTARTVERDFASSRFADGLSPLDYHLRNLLSEDATRRSFKTVWSAWRGAEPSYDERGHRSRGRGDRSARDLFRRRLTHFLGEVYASYHYDPARIELLATEVARARKRGLDLVLVVPPVHALQLEAVHAAGLWPAFERWKRDLVELVVRDARAYPEATPLRLWDFTGYASYNVVSVPAPEILAAEVPWYWESSHFKVELGDLVLERILGDADSGAADAFGVLLTPETLDRHLAGLATGRVHYRRTHPGDIALFQEVRRSAAAYGIGGT